MQIIISDRTATISKAKDTKFSVIIRGKEGFITSKDFLKTLEEAKKWALLNISIEHKVIVY